MQIDSFKRPIRVLAFILAISLLLTGALFAQRLAYEDKSYEAAIAAAQLQVLKQQDYELRFHAGKSIPDSSMTRRESLRHSALQLRMAESAWQSASAEQEQLRFLSGMCAFSTICSYFSGLLLVAFLLLMAARRMLFRRSDPGRGTTARSWSGRTQLIDVA